MPAQASLLRSRSLRRDSIGFVNFFLWLLGERFLSDRQLFIELSDFSDRQLFRRLSDVLSDRQLFLKKISYVLVVRSVRILNLMYIQYVF